jgi:cytochrome P450
MNEKDRSPVKEKPSEIDPSATLLSHLVSCTTDQKIIRDELLNILLASRDTTASLLSSVIYELAKNPDMLKKLRQEVLGTCGKEGAVSADAVRGMRYLRAILNETLRCHPVSISFIILKCMPNQIVLVASSIQY